MEELVWKCVRGQYHPVMENGPGSFSCLCPAVDQYRSVPKSEVEPKKDPDFVHSFQ